MPSTEWVTDPEQIRALDFSQIERGWMIAAPLVEGVRLPERDWRITNGVLHATPWIGASGWVWQEEGLLAVNFWVFDVVRVCVFSQQ